MSIGGVGVVTSGVVYISVVGTLVKHQHSVGLTVQIFNKKLNPKPVQHNVNNNMGVVRFLKAPEPFYSELSVCAGEHASHPFFQR